MHNSSLTYFSHLYANKTQTFTNNPANQNKSATHTYKDLRAGQQQQPRHITVFFRQRTIAACQAIGTPFTQPPKRIYPLVQQQH